MKNLLLMKHAESGWDKKYPDDWYRPLTEHGRIDASQIGETLIDENLVPDLILTSSAVRAHQTASIVANAFDRRCDLYSQDELYLAEMEVYFQEIQRTPDKIKTLLVVGHSPCLNRILQVVTERVELIPLAAVAYVKVQIDSWKEFKYDIQGDLIKVIRATPPVNFFQGLTSTRKVNVPSISRMD